jgi:hypothetical protein
VLKQFGIDLFRPGLPNLILDAILALSFLCLTLRIVLTRVGSGPALVDLGPLPLRTMFLVFGFGRWAGESANCLFREFSPPKALSVFHQEFFSWRSDLHETKFAVTGSAGVMGCSDGNGSPVTDGGSLPY